VTLLGSIIRVSAPKNVAGSGGKMGDRERGQEHVARAKKIREIKR